MENKVKRRLSIISKFESPKKLKLIESFNESFENSQHYLNDEDSHIIDLDEIDLNTMSEDDHRQTKELFEIFDFDSDGLISKSDLEVVLNGLGEDNSPEFINLMFSEINNDTKKNNHNDGLLLSPSSTQPQPQPQQNYVSYNQFCMKYMNIKYLDIEQYLKSSFDIFEEDTDQGFIKIEELGQLLIKLAGDNLSQDDISSLVKECIDIEKSKNEQQQQQQIEGLEEIKIEKIKFETFLTVMMKKFKKNILQRQPSGLISKSSIPQLRKQNSNSNNVIENNDNINNNNINNNNNNIIHPDENNKFKSLEFENNSLSNKIKELEKSLEFEKETLKRKLTEQEQQIDLIKKDEKEKLQQINEKIEFEKQQIEKQKQQIEKQRQEQSIEQQKLEQQRQEQQQQLLLRSSIMFTPNKLNQHQQQIEIEHQQQIDLLKQQQKQREDEILKKEEKLKLLEESQKHELDKQRQQLDLQKSFIISEIKEKQDLSNKIHSLEDTIIQLKQQIENTKNNINNNTNNSSSSFISMFWNKIKSIFNYKKITDSNNINSDNNNNNNNIEEKKNNEIKQDEEFEEGIEEQPPQQQEQEQEQQDDNDNDNDDDDDEDEQDSEELNDQSSQEEN